MPGIHGVQQLDARKIDMRSVPYHELLFFIIAPCTACKAALSGHSVPGPPL